MMALIKLTKTFPKFKLSQKLRIKLEYFSLIEKFILAIKFQNDKEDFFKLYDRKIVFYLLILEVESF